MATRAATFTAKIRNLKDYHYRMINSVSPMPSGVDIANTLKYFSQSLLQVLKDVPIIPSESYGPRQRDSIRLSVFPNLNYSGLYESVMNIIDVVPMVQHGQAALGEAILNVIGCLVPFLEYDLLDTLPLTVAGTLAVFPRKLQKDIVDLLCTHLLPVTLGYAGMNDNPTYATDSTASVIMMTFQHCENGAFHSQVLECVMSMKKNTFKDLLSVIAYGPPTSRAPAVHHLFHYWPQLNPAHSDRRGIHYKYTGFHFIAWTPVNCQRESCPNGGNVKAVKMCLDPALAIQCGDKPPPLYVCVDCVDQLRREHAQFLVDLLRPLEKVSLICENKNCTSPKNQAISTCFSIECASFNGYRPIRYCVTCHQNRHNSPPGSDHVFHLTIADVWSCEPDLQTFLVEAIVALLKEAQPMEEKRIVEMGEERSRHQHFEEEEDDEGEESEEHKLQSRYGIWLMVELCKPKEDVPIEILGRLLAMLFQWFDATAYLPDDNVGNALERLKPQYLYKWLQLVSKSHFEVMVSCLLPHPFEYARVGGHWDTLSSRTSQIKEGLNRMFCLVPYDIITYEVWNYVMPFWLEAIRTEVPMDERHELKVLLSKSFDTEMCPLPFAVDKMYHFVLERFDGTTAAVQDQNLQWLQILTSLDIWIPENILMNMFKTGVNSLANPQPVIDAPPPQLQQSAQPNVPPDYFPPGSPLSPSQFAEVFQFGPGYTEPPQEDVSDVTNLNCKILMLDLIIMQVQLQEIRPHQGLLNPLNKEIMSLLTDMLSAEWEGTHTCDTEEDIVECRFCELSSLWHQLAAKLMEWMAPEQELKIPEKDLPKIEDIQHRTFTDKGKSRKPVPEVEEENLDETEKQFKIQSLPSHLQLLHALLQTLEDESDSDALFFLLKTMKLLCLHGECLNYTQKEHRPFLKHCLGKRMIPNLWKLLQAEHSQIAIQCVPLLLHCLTLPTGADLLWKLVEDDFNNDDWRARFAAVEKVTVLARLLKIESIHNNQVIMTGLAYAFCYLIGCLNDTNTSIVERTTIYLETIKQSALRCMCQCMEFQFDSVISDRTLILQRLLLLQRVLKDEEIFSWHFFLNRFDTLCLEAQLDLESAGDISGQSLTDLASSDRQSEHFLKKINRARFALARTDSIRSVSGSIFAKPPYRRAASVPMHLVTRTQPPMKGKSQTLLVPDKDKPYPRQQSAPSFGRRDPRGSRFGLGMFSNYMFPGGQLREFTDEESNFAALLQRAMDLEGVDRETVHHLVTLLMKFMILCDQERVNEDRDMSKEQNIVLRHLNMLLGYNQTEKAFSAPPYKLRYSAVFNSYLSGLPMVLDRNFALGNIILPVSMALLQYVPSPQRYASDYQPPNYSLWLLEPHCRIYWLQVLIVILYKYQYNIAPACNTIQTLVRITINTIENQLHHCKRHEDTFGPASPMVTRNRDTSNVSVGDLENIQETDTPPQSPTDSQASAGDTVMFNLASSTAQYRRKADSDLTEDTDVESISPSHKASLQAKPLDPSAVAEIESTSIIYTEDTTTSTKSCLTTPPRPSTPTAPAEDLALPCSPSRRTISDPTTAPAPSSAHSSPVRTAPFSSPKRSPVHRAATLPPRVGSPTEELARLQGKGQPRRIAEYTAGSLTELRERPPSPSPTLQRKGTFQNFQLSKQRTLEQSVEEYMMQQIGLHAKEELVTPTSPSSPHPDLSVEHKMIEQIQAFESQNESKKKPLPSGSDQSSPEGPESSPTDETSDDKPVKIKDLKEETNKTEQSNGKEVPQDDTITELVVISEDSPKKLKYPLGKARSAGLLEASNTDSGSSPEFTGVKSRPQRAMSEKSPNKVQTGQLEKPGKDDTHQNESELDETSPTASPTPVPKLNPNYRQRKTRKTGLTTVELQRKIPELVNMATSSESTGRRRSRKSQLLTAKAQAQHKRSIASMKYEQTVQVDRCPKCNAVLESYDEDCLSMCIVALSTFIHREPALAAPLLFDMLESVARIASSTPYPWQAEISGLIIPGNCVSVARQFIRCVLHQLAPNGIFPQLFQTEIQEPDFLKTLAIALVDFIDLNCYSALQLVLEGVNEMKNITCEQMTNVVKNIATFVDYIAMETSSPTWATILVQFDLFFRRLPTLLPNPCDVTPVLKIMIAVLKIPGLTSVKGILEPFSKLLTFTVQSCSFKLQQLLDICSLCNRAFTKERDKLYLSRSVIFELVQALKFKSSLPDENLLMLVQFVCIDSGGTIGPINISEELSNAVYNPYSQSLISTNAAECMKQHLNDCVELISDLHTINKVKNNLKGGSLNLNEDTLGSHLKAGIAQFVALEFTRGNGRDNRAISRYLPWLYHPPTAMQQGPKEFIDCVGHIRLLSWLLLGSLSHTAITKANGCITCQPIPLEASPHIADHIMVIMTGFAEQSKASVLHMSSLFHAFILCQLWTMYCESFAALSSPLADSYTTAHGTVMDFWARVTPGILQLLSHSKVMSEMVNLHFLGLIEALQECNSTILSKLFPMWTPILFAYNSQLPGHMQVRLSMCQNWQPKESQPTDDNSSLDPSTLLTWLKRLQFKVGQIEVQSSQATQFYTV